MNFEYCISVSYLKTCFKTFNELRKSIADSKNLTVIHIPASSGPMAWTFVAVLFNGAAMIDTYDLPARVIANVAIWSILVCGMYFLATFGDYTIGFEMFWLSLGEHSRVVLRQR